MVKLYAMVNVTDFSAGICQGSESLTDGSLPLHLACLLCSSETRVGPITWNCVNFTVCLLREWSHIVLTCRFEQLEIMYLPCLLYAYYGKYVILSRFWRSIFCWDFCFYIAVLTFCCFCRIYDYLVCCFLNGKTIAYIIFLGVLLEYPTYRF